MESTINRNHRSHQGLRPNSFLFEGALADPRLLLQVRDSKQGPQPSSREIRSAVSKGGLRPGSLCERDSETIPRTFPHGWCAF